MAYFRWKWPKIPDFEPFLTLFWAPFWPILLALRCKNGQKGVIKNGQKQVILRFWTSKNGHFLEFWWFLVIFEIFFEKFQKKTKMVFQIIGKSSAFNLPVLKVIFLKSKMEKMTFFEQSAVRAMQFLDFFQNGQKVKKEITKMTKLVKMGQNRQKRVKTVKTREKWDFFKRRVVLFHFCQFWKKGFWPNQCLKSLWEKRHFFGKNGQKWPKSAILAKMVILNATQNASKWVEFAIFGHFLTTFFGTFQNWQIYY